MDPYYLVNKAREVGYHSKVIAAGRTINDHMPTHVFNLISDALNDCEKSVKNSKMVVLGLSYKENVGDPRESPATDLIGQLMEKNAQVVAVDPYINECSFVSLEKDIYKAISGADALVLVTAHDEFKNIDFEKAKELMRLPLFIDGRRIYDPQKIKDMGFHYRGIGAINH